MALPSSNKPKIEGLGTSDRKLTVAKPEHIKRALLILLGLSLFLVLAALVKGCSNSRAYQERLEDRRAAKSKQEDEAAKRAQANTDGGNDPASTFQQDLATFQRNGAPANAATGTTDPAAANAAAETGTTAGGPNDAAAKLQEARNEEQLRAYQDLREPLALAVPNGDKPVGTTTSASVRAVSAPEPEATTQQQEPADAETQGQLA